MINLIYNIVIISSVASWQIGVDFQNRYLFKFFAVQTGSNLTIKFNPDGMGEKYIYIDDDNAFLYCEQSRITEAYTGTNANYHYFELKKINNMNVIFFDFHEFPDQRLSQSSQPQ
jgi:hypothetical protein